MPTHAISKWLNRTPSGALLSVETGQGMLMREDRSLVGRVVIVTGGSRGLGKEIALTLAEAGSKVVITARTRSPDMDQTMAELTSLGGPGCALGLAADVRNYEDCQRVVAETISAFGSLHVLFNNAGLGLQVFTDVTGKPRTMFWETPLEPWNDLLQTNVNGVFYMSRAATPGMIAQGFGKIVNLSTNRHTMLRLGGSSYGGAKAFVEMASRIWAKELAGSGVTVNVFLPGGPVDTGIRKGDLPDGFKFNPISIMRAPTRWLASDLSNAHSGERFVARLWDESLPLPDRIAAARESGIELPQIM
jgi:NAD(P)-dependent dehydrogenase (short-subunit alcohol dehydrogenase family)